MKETSFIKQNIDKWNTYEKELGKQKKNPSVISKLFVQITDDLAFAQTFYKNRSVRVYLNGIAQLLFNDINKRSRINSSRILEFWTKDLPVVVYKTRFELLFSFIVFSIMVGIGVLTSIYEPDFASTILGDSYIEMTLENIENDDPMAVYKKQNGLDMFLGITLNNIKVAFVTFLFGIFFGIGTFFILLRNGIMLGTFQYFFIERDLFRDSFLTIWQHGTLEISAIIIAGAAGFTIGRGLILPGTYTRFQSLRLSARRGLKIMLGLIPVFIMAGFIEGFFTRYTEVPDIVRLTTILLSLAFILFYFVYYPFRVAKFYPEKLESVDKLNEQNTQLPDFNSILSNEQLFGGTLRVIKEQLPNIVKFSLLASIIGGMLIGIGKGIFFPNIEIPLVERASVFKDFVDFSNNPLLFVVGNMIVSLTLINSALCIYNTRKNYKLKLIQFISRYPMVIVNSIISSMFIQLPFFLPIGWALFISFFSMPILFLAFYRSYAQNLFIITSLGRTIKGFSYSFGKFALLNLIFIIISFLILLLANPEFYREILSFIHWNLWLEEQYVNLIFNVIVGFIYFFSTLLCITIVAVANNLLFHTIKEITSCDNLIKSIKHIGTKNTIRGYELE